MGDQAPEARLARQEEDSSDGDSFDSYYKPPPDPGLVPQDFLGVFSQTLLPSPVIQWILPARLRSKHHNDVVFIGQARVQIKEAVVGGYLEDRTEKADFDGNIISARVMNVNTDLPWETQLQSGNDYNGPAQLLILSLDLRELQFIYCSPNPGLENGEDFISFRRALPMDVSLAQRFGKHLAVDPKSRAIAISASNDFIGFMRLHPLRDIQAQIIGSSLNPIKQESFHRLPGSIMFMEFLYPPTPDDKSIVLLLIVHKDKSTYAVTYTWKEDEDLHCFPPTKWQIRLRSQDQMPTMIVPLTKESSFLLITPTSMAVYPSSGSQIRPSRYPLIAPDPEINEASLWTRWARPARNWLYSQSRDGIYLCREDGWIYLLEFGNEGELESTTCLGQLHCDVDMAFSLLDMGHEGGDFILAAGSKGDGGLFIQEARGQPQCVQRFLNWAPVIDATIVTPEPQSIPLGKIVPNRLFACSESSSGKGAINEFRFGVEAQIGIAAPLHDMANIRGMWVMDDHSTGTIYVLLSDPVTSLLLSLDTNLQEGICALDDEETGLASTQTLSAGYTPDGVVIQVTETATHLFITHSSSLNTSIPHPSETRVLAVAVDGPTSTILTAIQHGSKKYLCHSRVVVGNDSVALARGEAIKIKKEPICLHRQTFGVVTFAFLGNIDGTITVYHIEDQKISLLFETVIDVDVGEDVARVVESLVTVQNHPNGSLRAFLLCGLRGGMLVSFEVDFNAASLIGLVQREATRIGITAVRLQSETSFALLTCDSELWRVSYSSDLPSSKYMLHRVWITDQDNLAWSPIALHGFGLIGCENSNLGNAIGPLYCFADQKLLICNLKSKPGMVLRRISLPGQPVRLIYSSQLQHLVVSYTITEVEDRESPFTSTTTSYIDFVHPDSDQPVIAPNARGEQSDRSWRPRSDCGEIITCIMDWIFEKNGDLYHLMAIGTTAPAPDSGSNIGRLILLAVRPNASNTSHINVDVRSEETLRGPVRAIAACGDSLLVGCGKWLVPFSSRNSTMRWARNAPMEFPSQIVAITVHQKFIIVTTSRHSWTILEMDSHPVHGSAYYHKPICSGTNHDGLAHIVSEQPYFHGSPLAFMSERGGVVSIRQIGKPLEMSPEIRVSDSILRFAIDPTKKNGLYGFALNGAIHRFYLPKHKEMPILQLLQNLCYLHETICPSSPRRLRQINPLTFEKGSHINGDFIARVARRGPDFLRYLLKALNASKSYNLIKHRYRYTALEAIGSYAAEDVIEWLRLLVD